MVARQVNILWGAGAYADVSPRLIKNGGVGSPGPYNIPHISVDSYARSNGGPDIQTVGMELAHVISQVRKASQALEVGGLREVMVRADDLVVLVHVLNDEYFVACAILPDANAGKARYLLRLLAPQIQSEL